MSKSNNGLQYATVEYTTLKGSLKGKYNCNIHGLTPDQLLSITSKPEWKASGHKYCRAHAMDIINHLAKNYGFDIKSHKTSGGGGYHYVYLLERNY